MLPAPYGNTLEKTACSRCLHLPAACCLSPLILCLFLCGIQFYDDPVVFHVHRFPYRPGCAIWIQQPGFPRLSAADGHVVACNMPAVSFLCPKFHLSFSFLQLRYATTRKISVAADSTTCTTLRIKFSSILAMGRCSCYTWGGEAFASLPAHLPI